MATYPLTIKRFEQYEYDEELEEETTNSTGYAVFSRIQVGPYTSVRAVVDSVNGTPAHPKSKVWFVEWAAQADRFNVTHLLTERGKETNRADALRLAERAAEVIGRADFPADARDGFVVLAWLKDMEVRVGT